MMMTEVISHFLPFPFPVLCFIPIPMGFPWDSRYHWESHSHVHLYSNVLLLPISRHWSLLASPFSKAICEHCESTDTGWCITWYACLLSQLSAATILSQTVYNDHQIQQFSIVFLLDFIVAGMVFHTNTDMDTGPSGVLEGAYPAGTGHQCFGG